MAEAESEDYKRVVKPKHKVAIRASWTEERRDAQRDVAKERLAFSYSGRRHSPETRAKIAASLTGKKKTFRDPKLRNERLATAAREQWKNGKGWANLPESAEARRATFAKKRVES